MTSVPDIVLNDGRPMPQLGLGMLAMPLQEAEALCAAAIAMGYPAIDTAMIYGNEAQVGQAVRAASGPVFVTTKLWITDMGSATQDAFAASMDRLRLDRVDLYLIHWPMPALGTIVETWEALIRLREDDERMGSIGVSNFRIEDLRALIDATGVVPAVNQIELHPRFQQAELRAFHAEHGIVTTSWSPLGRGGGLDDPLLQEIARKHGRTAAQVVLRWHIELGLIAIPKSGNPVRLAENLALFDFALDADDLARIATLDRADGRTGPHPDSFRL